jgi:RNA-binding protein
VRGKGILHRIGYVLHVSNTKNIILKAENVPQIGNQVIDEKLKQVGIVFDIFGPTSSPYVAVKPDNQNSELLINQVLYAVPSNERRNKRKNR